MMRGEGCTAVTWSSLESFREGLHIVQPGQGWTTKRMCRSEHHLDLEKGLHPLCKAMFLKKKRYSSCNDYITASERTGARYLLAKMDRMVAIDPDGCIRFG
jgi:hypothetical protein